jgi:hypothetical protein
MKSVTASIFQPISFEVNVLNLKYCFIIILKSIKKFV